MIRGNKREKAVLLLALVAAAVLLLAASLNNLEFQPGLPIIGSAATAIPQANPTNLTPVTASASIYAQIILAATFALGLIFLGVILVRHLGWRLLRFDLILLVAVLLVLMALPAIIPGGATTTGTVESITPIPETIYETTPLGAPPQSFTVWIAAGLGLLVILIAVWLLRHRPHDEAETNSLERETEQAAAAIRAGQDLSEVIQRCYRQMSHILAQEQDLERDQAMTVREFERLLSLHGVPAGPVHQLTGLFEAVRYGPGRPTGSQDEQTALECLEAITRYCREAKVRVAA